MATAADLTRLLSAFSDASATNFSGFPTSRAAAREAWSAAFDTYFAAADVAPAIAVHASSMTRTGVKSAFKTALQLLPGIVPASAASDLAGAWEAGLLAVAPATPIPPSTIPPPFVWSSFTNLDAQKTALGQALVPLFVIPGFTASADLSAIAKAIHEATIGVQAIVVLTATGIPQVAQPLVNT